MTSHAHRVCSLIRLLLLPLMFPWGGLCGGREEVLAKGWTLDLLIERYNQDEKAVLALDQGRPPSENWGGAPYFCGLLNMVEKLGDRAALPFLEEKSLMTNASRFIRARAAEIYASLATGEECATFLPKILKIDDEDKTIISWRYAVTPACLNKVEAAIAQNEMSKETLARLVDALVVYTQFAYSASEARHVDDFLLRHCEGYPTSWQRLALWTNILDADKKNEVKREKCLPIKQSIEAVPPRKRIDLRERFPDLPPLPDDTPTRSPVKVAFAIIAGVAAVVAAWFVLRRKKAHETP